MIMLCDCIAYRHAIQRVIPDTSLLACSVRFFLLGDEVYYAGTEKVSPKTAFNNYKNHTTEYVIIT